MKIGIVGTRRRSTMGDYYAVAHALKDWLCQVPEISNNYTRLVSGGCHKGADCFVPRLTKEFRLNKPIIHKPQYHLYGDNATFVRNTLVAKDSDILIACVAPDRKGGTENTITKFQEFHPEGKLIIV